MPTGRLFSGSGSTLRVARTRFRALIAFLRMRARERCSAIVEAARKIAGLSQAEQIRINFMNDFGETHDYGHLLGSGHVAIAKDHSLMMPHEPTLRILTIGRASELRKNLYFADCNLQDEGTTNIESSLPANDRRSSAKSCRKGDQSNTSSQ